MPVVSVIIPCYNAQEWIAEALTSLDVQGVPDLEVIVVDDGSTDASAAIIQREFPHVRLIRIPNAGHPRARNVGIQAANGSYIQFLDADDYLPPNKIKTQLEALESSGADVAYGDWQYLRRQADGRYVTASIISRQLKGDIDAALVNDFWCPNHTYLYRRSIVKRVGGFDERFQILADCRFVEDCARSGAAFLYCPGLPVPYRIHSPQQNSRSDPRRFVRECFDKAVIAEQWWQDTSCLTTVRRESLLQVYGYVARASFEDDRPTFDKAYTRLMCLDPHYVPERPRHLALVARALGYRRAEHVAYWYRRAKRTLEHVARTGSVSKPQSTFRE